MLGKGFGGDTLRDKEEAKEDREIDAKRCGWVEAEDSKER